MSIQYPTTVLGIAGGSGSGKSTVMRRVIESVGAVNVAVLDHDRYYFDQKHLSAEERARVNFDHPSSLETALLCLHVDELLAGRPIEKPIYDFSRHTRTDRTETVQPRPLIIIEGILVLAEPELAKRMDLRVFVDADDDIRLSRRIRRDIEERGRSLNSVLDQYETTVRPMHLTFVAPSRSVADLVIPRGGYNEVAIGVLVSHLRSRVLGF